MKRRGVRLALVALFLLVAAGAGFTLYREDERAVAARGAAREFDLAAQRVQVQVDEARTALLATLAPGQGQDFWLPRAAAAIESARGEIAAMKSRSADGGVLNDLDAASSALDQADEVRVEVDRQLRNDLRTQATVAVTGRGLEAFASAAERVEGARLGELSHADAELAAIRAYEVLGAGLTLGLGVLLIALLVPSGAGEASSAQAVGEELTLHEVTHIAPLPAAAAESHAPEPSPAPAAPEPSPANGAESQAPQAPPVQVDRRKAPELRAAADLCTDFARLVDAGEMPALLERAAKLLDATGFIVWVAEAGGQKLRPMLAHGYSPQALSRLPAIPRHADNATAAAYRHAEMQIVRTNGMSPGAIVVPVLGPSGCIGVIAAEVRHGREASESARALARIVSAQIATLIGSAAESVAGGTEAAGARQVS